MNDLKKFAQRLLLLMGGFLTAVFGSALLMYGYMNHGFNLIPMIFASAVTTTGIWAIVKSLYRETKST